MAEAGNLKNITISQRADEICDSLVETGLFAFAVDAYRAAIAVALANDLSVNRDLKMIKNKWDTASVFYDRESNVETMLLLFGFNKENLVREGKLLAEAGLEFLESKRQLNSDLMSYLM